MSIKANAWVRVYGPVVMLVALAAYAGMYLRWPSLASQVDLLVYRFGAGRVLAGLDLYSVGLTGNPRTLLFDYTPFAALCSLPLTLVTSQAAQVIGLVVNAALLVYVVRRTLVRLGVTTSTGLWSLGALLVGLLCWLEPVRLSLQLGQVNLLILAVVVADLLGPDTRRWAGVGIGVVAGVKLTPALFVVFLVLTGRRRAAVVATATFAATVVLGFLVLPRDSGWFWLRGGFDDVARITSDPVANTSLRGLFVRMHLAGAPTVAVTGAGGRRVGRRGAGVAAGSGGARGGRGRDGVGCAVAVQLEPSLGVGGAAGGPPRASRVRRGQPVGARRVVDVLGRVRRVGGADDG